MTQRPVWVIELFHNIAREIAECRYFMLPLVLMRKVSPGKIVQAAVCKTAKTDKFQGHYHLACRLDRVERVFVGAEEDAQALSCAWILMPCWSLPSRSCKQQTASRKPQAVLRYAHSAKAAFDRLAR